MYSDSIGPIGSEPGQKLPQNRGKRLNFTFWRSKYSFSKARVFSWSLGVQLEDEKLGLGTELVSMTLDPQHWPNPWLIRQIIDLASRLQQFKPVFRIRDWRIRILLFSSVTFKMPTKLKICLFFSKFFVYYFLKVHSHHSSQIKSHQEGTKQ